MYKKTLQRQHVNRLARLKSYEAFRKQVRASRADGLGVPVAFITLSVLFSLLFTLSFTVVKWTEGRSPEELRGSLCIVLSAVGAGLLYWKGRGVCLNRKAARILKEDYCKVSSVGDLPKDPHSRKALLYRANRRAARRLAEREMKTN